MPELKSSRLLGGYLGRRLIAALMDVCEGYEVCIYKLLALCFEAEVEVIEQLGSEIVLDTRVGRSAFVANVDPSLRMKVYDRLKLAMNPVRLHLFDAGSEAAI